jgi:exodeoxyribonuclease VII large subunit
MPEEINGRNIFSLLEVTKSIQKTIANRYKRTYWIKAEMNKLNYYQRSGHCYPDLIEKKNGQVIAQIRANLWKDDYQKVNSNFQRVLKEPLKDGIKILFSATINFHPLYGLALRIIDIDPSFTLGDLEKEKQETIKKLQAEQIFTKNKKLKFPVLPQRIAVISVETSKGYADFLKVFESANRSWNYSFFHLLFPSLLQGDNAIRTIIEQLRRIEKVIHHFDVVAIVRGGGGDIGLSCYNNYDLAKEIVLFPIPVITGIGHSTNETVAEMIAYENAITPTKLAEFLIQKFHNFSVPVQKAEEKIIDKSRRLIQEEKIKFSSEVKLLRSVTRNILVQNQNEVKQQVQSLFQQLRFRIRSEKEYLTSAGEGIKKGTYQFCASEKQNILQFAVNLKKDVNVQLKQVTFLLNTTEQNLTNLSPRNVLKRGYSITQLNGISIRSFDQVKEGNLLNTLLYDGNVLSTVKSANKPIKND